MLGYQSVWFCQPRGFKEPHARVNNTPVGSLGSIGLGGNYGFRAYGLTAQALGPFYYDCACGLS